MKNQPAPTYTGIMIILTLAAIAGGMIAKLIQLTIGPLL